MLTKPFTSDIESHTEQPLDSLAQLTIYKVQYPIIGSIPEVTQLQSESPLEVPTNLDEATLQQRIDFLRNFYNQIANRVLLIIIFQILSCMKWFRLIVVYYKKSYLNDQWTFEEYATYYINGYRYDKENFRFESYHYDSYRGFIERSLIKQGKFRWTFWLFLSILFVSIIIVPILRKARFIKKYQKLIYHIQNILFAFIFVGITGVNSLRDNYSEIMRIAMIIFIGLWIFLKAMFFNTIYNFINFNLFKILLGTFMVSSFINFIGATGKSSIPSVWIFIEFIVCYIIYYFCQLNKSVQEPIYLEDDNFCKIKQYLQKIFRKSQVDVETQQILTQNFGKNYCIINRNQIEFGLGLIFMIVIMIIGIFYLKFLILFVLIVLQFIGLFFQTQVVSNQIDVKTETNDFYLSVCLVPLDMIFAAKNIIRSKKRYENSMNL